MNNSITYLKALGIVLMAMDHSMCSVPFVVTFIAMFHMPMFFFASGYCFKEKYLSQPLTYLKRRAKGLYWPFIKWGVLFLLLRPLFFVLHVYDTEYGFHGVGAEPYDLKQTLWCCWIIVTQMRGTDWLLSGYWFLNALFFGSLIAWVIIRFTKNVTYAPVIALLLLVLVHITNFHIVFLNLNTRAFAAAFYLVGGYALKMKNVQPFSLKTIIGSLVLIFIASRFWSMPLNTTEYEGWHLFPFVLMSLLASWTMYSLFVRYTLSGRADSIVRYVGENTLTILTWHLLAFKLVSLLIIVVYHLPIGRLGEFPVIVEYAYKGWWALYLVVGVALPLAFLHITVKKHA